eukprot:CAMPEP_0181030322 /NCGR_PEP_ID=MMETSP1070-20121207/5661_1 /TAXON_ID=265543 /ORGANISM="Minutocellus polymorphus, Strain NH13" /LENGTH=619 /DNA_ID=CAMNT_0023107673 /DNA_START=217 /DNA_END=2076 /DNA_ORIENTATION=-
MDHSVSPSPVAKLPKPPKETGNFVSKAHDMIENCSALHPEIASWNDVGDTVLIHSPTQLEQHYLPQYFQHNKFPSFVRQLNLYGFKNVTKELATNSDNSISGSHNSGGSASGTSGSGLQAFRNPNFLRGRKDLVANIQRSKTGDRAQRKSKQDEAVRAVSEELGGRLEELESHVSILNGKVDDISGKLDLVINMLASAGIGSAQVNGGGLSYAGGMEGMGGGTPYSMDGIPRQAPPPYTTAALNDSAQCGNGSQVEIDGWLGTVQAGQKRDRNSSTQGTNSVRKLPKRSSEDDGKKFISSEGSMSSGESERGQNESGQRHMFYDVTTGQRVSSPLDESDKSQLPDPSCEDLELDPQTSSILMNLNNESVEGDPELGQGGSSAGGIEPIPFDSDDIELPDIILAGDDQPLGHGGGAVGVSPDQGAPGGGRKSFSSKNRNFLIAGLMLTAVAAAVGAGLSTQVKNNNASPETATTSISDSPPDTTIDLGGDFEEDIPPPQLEIAMDADAAAEIAVVESVESGQVLDEEEYSSDAIPPKIDVAGLLPPTDAAESSALKKEGADETREPDRGGSGASGVGASGVGASGVWEMVTPPPTVEATIDESPGVPTAQPTAEPTFTTT